MNAPLFSAPVLAPVLALVLALAGLCLAHMAGPARADGAVAALISPSDAALLDTFDARRTSALDAAAGAGSPNDQRALQGALAGRVLPFDEGFDPSGAWRCRTLRLGGPEGLRVYGWFDCRIFDDGAGWVVQKTTGSERAQGRLYRLSAERLLFLGAGHGPGEAPAWYGTAPARNLIAVLTRLDDGRMRLEVPAPLAGTKFDILEFAR